MHTTQHARRCPVYLHPAAATSPSSVSAIQRTAGLLVIITPKSGTAHAVQAPTATDNFGPWGGDAA
ncbi:hypothetical protein NLO95_08735 [Pseudomonas syringae]|nr:hypothetical protein [Pseudomonas syringae]